MLKTLIKELGKLNLGSVHSDFLCTWDESTDTIKGVLLLTNLLRKLYLSNISPKVYDTGLAVSIFRDNSTRTRYSFAAAANLLGLSVADLEEGKSQVAHGETVLETTNMLSFLTKVIGIRDDIYLGVGHAYMQEVARSAQLGFDDGILATRPSVINLQSDIDHPTQTMSDLAHLENYFGSLQKLRGKKLVVSWAHSPSYGKPLSVPQGVIGLMSRFGMDITLAYPKGYNLEPSIEATANKQALASGGSFAIVQDMAKAFKGADIVYPKSWAPYEVMLKRTKLLKLGDTKGLEKLNKKCLAINAQHKDWTCTEKLMKTTKNGNALYMHCLPADISGVSCKDGEVKEGVFTRYRKQTYLQASYKPFVIAAMVLLTQFKKETPKVVARVLRGGQAVIK